VVAWIGAEKITASELSDRIAQEIDERVGALYGLPAERVAELKAQAQKQFSAPQARLGKLREILAREVLYREGLEREVEKAQRVQKRVEDFRRDAVVEEMVLSALRERIKTTEGDLRNFYRANPSRYKERASARVRIALLADEAKAREALAAKSEEDFARIAREGSLETATREHGGLLEEPLVEGQPVPVLGPAPELVKAVFETQPQKTIAAPVKLPSGYAAAFVRERSPERTPPFEEVRERVAKEYLQEKEAEVQSALVKELFEKHRVSIATEEFLGGDTAKGDAKKGAEKPSPAKGGPAKKDGGEEAGSPGAPGAAAPQGSQPQEKP
jgi:parvulin-like peptidyl-prolyl isomerase